MKLPDLGELARSEADLPVTGVERWSVDADGRGIRLLDLATRPSGDAGSRVGVFSLHQSSQLSHSTVLGRQVTAALLATHLNGERLTLDHRYPSRLVAPNRAGVLST